MLRHAMIQPSFIPPRPIRELRDLTRRRKKLIAAGSSEKNRIQKVLEDANVKLGNVLSDVFGVSGQRMLEALLEGHAGPEEIARLAQRRARQKIPALVAALQKHRLSEHHRRMIRFRVEHMELLERQILRLDEEIATQIRQIGLARQWELLPRASRGYGRIVRPPFWRRPEPICRHLEMRRISVRGPGCARAITGVRVKTRAALPTRATRGCGAA